MDSKVIQLELEKATNQMPSKAMLSIWPIKWLFIISGTAMTMLVASRGPVRLIVLDILCAFIIYIFLTYRFHILENVYRHTNRIIFALACLFTIYLCYSFMLEFRGNISLRLIQEIGEYISIPAEYHGLWSIRLSIFASIVASFAIFTFAYAFIDWFASFSCDWIKCSDLIEKRYLVICGIIAILAISIIFSVTNVFYGASNYDIIYTTDSSLLVPPNAYLFINAAENDIRQPLFGVFAAPFAVGATVISKLLYFIPNSYPIVLNIIQVLLLLACNIMLVRMLQLEGFSKVCFLIIFTTIYPSLLFALCMEQYVFAVFWLLMLIYSHINRAKNDTFYYIGATGSLLTSIVLFPLVAYPKGIKGKIKGLLLLILKSLAFIVLFGQLPIILNAVYSFKGYVEIVKPEFQDRLLQFINFIALCFIKPHASVDITHITYQLEPVTTVNILGVILLVVAIIGFAFNYKKRIAQISIGWIVYSFIILCLLGWGTNENGLVLYALYFAWAYVLLVLLAIEKIFKKRGTIQFVIYIVVITLIAYINIPAIHEIIAFGVQYYPVR